MGNRKTPILNAHHIGEVRTLQKFNLQRAVEARLVKQVAAQEAVYRIPFLVTAADRAFTCLHYAAQSLRATRQELEAVIAGSGGLELDVLAFADLVSRVDAQQAQVVQLASQLQVARSDAAGSKAYGLYRQAVHGSPATGEFSL